MRARDDRLPLVAGRGAAGAPTALNGAGGAQGRDRTTDTVIFSHVLYQLSYLGALDGQGARSNERLP